MQNMEYDYFSDAAAQQYPVFNFGTNLNPITQRVDSDASAQYQIDHLATGSIGHNAFEYKYDATTMNPDSVGAMSMQMTSQPSPAQAHMSVASIENSNLDMDMDMQSGRRASSEEKDCMTPAQSRRKAQNRAAQRAFRERKERHVRDLEAKLTLLTTTTSSLQSDNERLKLMLQKAKAENEHLRASATTSPVLQQAVPAYPHNPLTLSRSLSGRSSVSDDGSSIVAGGTNATAASSISSSSTPDKQIGQSNLLSASATWDLLQSHPRYTSGCVDITQVYERLRKLAKMDGSGPMFQEDDVRRVIEEAGGNGADELI